MVSSTYGGVKAREALYRHRARPALKEGNVRADIVVKACILAFPSIWVGCNAVL